MKTIIAATDFSPIALNAVNYAADMASVIEAHLVLLNVSQYPVTVTDIPVPAEALGETMTANRESLEQLRNHLLHKTGNKIQIDIEVRAGGIVPEIKDFCEDAKPYAVVIGIQESGAVERMLFGDNSFEAIQNLSCPLILVPQGARFNRISKMGLACDLHHVIENVPANVISRLVNDFHAQLHVLYVGKEHEGKKTALRTVQESAWLQEMLNDIQPEYHFIKGNDIDAAINDFADNNNLDLLMVIPRHHGWVNNIFHRSHTHEVAMHAHVPIVAVHEGS